MEHTNINWPCENQEKHEVKTHPSDVVFWYDEPYSQSRTYVNCDLKSYAKGSITAASVREAIESLAKTLSCAEVGQEFNDNSRNGFSESHFGDDSQRWLALFARDLTNSIGRLMLNFM